MMMYLHSTLERSRANGPGVRAVIWFQGCTLKCPGCFNPAAQPADHGTPADTADMAEAILARPGIEGVTFSGGEPFQQPEALLDLVHRIRPSGLTIVIFTGYTLDELNAMPLGPAILGHVDTLIAGRYHQASHNIRGLVASSNQRVHHLTPRYAAIDFKTLPNREAIVHRDGSVTFTGLHERTHAAPETSDSSPRP